MLNIKQFPDLMAHKTILYVHGFASSGQSGTVQRIREVFPEARVIAPDLPIHPAGAMTLLKETCQQEHPDLIIGTSMGGMYTEQLYGYDRICVNPALEMGETMRAHGMTGTQQFQNPRQDGIQEFYVDKALIKEYKEQSEHRFEGLTALSPSHPTNSARFDLHDSEPSPVNPPSGELSRVWGLFGDEDTIVDTYDLFASHYPQALHFHGEHRMNDHSFLHGVVPVIRWIDDRQQHRQRPIVYIGTETLADSYQHPASSMMKAVNQLIEHYQVYFVSDNHDQWQPWLQQHVGVPAWHHDVYTHRHDLLYGDYLISRHPDPDTMATPIAFGSDKFKSWDDIIDYFSLLGGQ